MKNLSIFIITLSFIVSCGGGGGSSQTNPSVNIVNPSIVSFSSSSQTVTVGDSVTISWSSSNATSCVASGDWSDSISTNDSIVKVLNEAKTYNFTLTCSGEPGSNEAVSTISVEAISAQASSIDSFVSSASSIVVNDSVTLTWTTTAMSVCVAKGDWDGEKGLNDSEIIELVTVKTYEFILECTDADGTMVDESISVIVNDETDQSLDVAIIDEGRIANIWGGGASLFFFDEFNEYQSCTSNVCPSVDWSFEDSGTERGNVLEVVYTQDAGHAGLVIGPTDAVNLSDYSEGTLSFDIKITNKGLENLSEGFKLKVETTSSIHSGELLIEGIVGDGSWETINFPVSNLVASGDLQLNSITVPIVLFPNPGTSKGVSYQLDNVRYTGIKEGATPPSGPNEGGGGSGGGNTADYEIINYGAGSISTAINTESYKCGSNQNATWIWNAGVVYDFIDSCDNDTGKPISAPVKRIPQVTEPAANKKLATHRWWGSIPFIGETQVSDNPDNASPAHISADPIRARISNVGAKLMGIPSGYKLKNGLCGNCYPQYEPPSWSLEVFEGIAIANSNHQNMNAFLKDYSDGSVTVLWKSNDTDVMEATFVHGSPYTYFKVFDGTPIIKTKSEDGGEKGVFYEQGDSIGIWTSVSGIKNNFVVTGEGVTTYTDTTSNAIGISNATGEFTVSYIPEISGEPGDAMSDYFINKSRNVIASVDINYQVDRSDNSVTVTHSYFDESGSPVDTVIGLHPMHWKFSDNNQTSNYKIRSARGILKFAERNSFNYSMPFVGVLPSLPSIEDTFDQNKLEQLVRDFVNEGSSSWLDRSTTNDTYWSGKIYGKVAELIAIAKSIGLTNEANQLTEWLKSELEDWLTAETDGVLDEQRYFVYDDTWDTLLGMEEAYGSHTRLADHHFHYGYFVRAASEICRSDKSWCGSDKYGPMIELLIRDYAAGEDDDDLFPAFRNFDPANGFSWADGKADALQGNNNESTSEAANSYGAMILYGLITENDELVNKGIYLHTSTSNAYWQYWNDIDGYNSVGDDYKNFIPGYPNISTSIIWSSGADFSTWFSPEYAHILGIQGLPSNTLIMHVSQYKDYMMDYIDLGIGANNEPSDLGDDLWRDLWWNLIAMVDPERAIADYNTVSTYDPEAGESKAHTYHWIHTLNALGHVQTGTGNLTANYPAAMAFKKNGIMNYLAYNFSDSVITVSYSNGKTMTVEPNNFKLESN